MLEHREKVATKESEIEALEEEADEFDTESPLPRAVELDMNVTDTDQTMVINLQKPANLIGMIPMKVAILLILVFFFGYFLCRKQEQLVF